MNIPYIAIGIICLLFLIFLHKYFINRVTPDINNNKIPKVIYQTYKDKNVPPIVKERWLKLNPEYEYHLYDDNDCYNFLIKYYRIFINKIYYKEFFYQFLSFCFLNRINLQILLNIFQFHFYHIYKRINNRIY